MKKKLLPLFVLSFVFSVLVISCGNKNKLGTAASGETEVIIPCNDFKSDKSFFRANQSANSQDMGMARDKALLNVKAKLASLIESKIKNVMTNYRKEVDAGGAQEYTANAEGEARDITSQSLNDIVVICEKVTKSQDGKFNCYMAIEMSKDALAKKAANRVNQDDKLKVAYDQKKFREVFDKEMEQLSGEQP